MLRFKSRVTPPPGLHAEKVFDVEPLPEDPRRVGLVDDRIDLGLWWAAPIDDDTSYRALSSWLLVINAQDVEYVPEFEPSVVETLRLNDSEAQAACPITTPPYDERQGYLQATEARAAWALPGGRGQGVIVGDVEGDWNAKHEDLPKLTHVVGRPQGWGWRQHGTAVLGVLAAKENGKGMTGIVPDVDGVYTASLGDVGAARAIHETAKKMSPGDVLVIELHGPGPNSRGKKGQQGFVPMEWWQAEFEAIKWATNKGVVVVEAAGNGAEDLDAAIYDRKFSRARRDSGAILVGAGTSTLRQDVKGAPPPRSRLGFSNYGSRVDVHGWGEDVATLDYGDLQGCSSADRKYTARFSGTSSASPVVAGAVVVVEGVYRAKTGGPLAPDKVRALLSETGTPQQASSSAPLTQQIGPLPNVAAALGALQLLP